MKRHPISERGATLVVALGAVVTIAALVGVTVSSTGHNGRITGREDAFAAALNAADGALEYGYSSWRQSIRVNGMRATDNTQVNFAAPTASLHSGFTRRNITFSGFGVANVNQWGETTDSSGTTITTPVSAQLATIPGHPGWSGTASFYRAQVTATLPARGRAMNVTLRRNFQITGIPLFQAAIFFEHDIELMPGALMIVDGLVHSNNSLWLATANSSNLQFLKNVSYAGDYHEAFNTYMDSTPPQSYPPLWADGLPSATSTTKASQLRKTARMEPFGTEAAQIFSTTDSNPNNDGMREFIEPPVTTSTDPSEIAGIRYYNQASVRVAINRAKPAADPTRIVIRNQNNVALPAATDSAIRAALNVSTSTIYDWREGEAVSVTNVNMKALDTALGGMGSGFNGVFYIHDVTATGKNAIRLQNGAVLNRDISIASNNGVYIQGDYNTGGVNGSGAHDPALVPSNASGNPSGTDANTAPGYVKRATAVMADSVMILSNAWDDANTTLAVTSRVASHTTVNTGILSGIVPSNYEGNGQYSGGPNNLPRFLERWAGQDFTYIGSMVQTFNSKQFDGTFDTGPIFAPPNRKWRFDSSFLTQPPPGTFQSVQFSRGRWERL